MKLPTASQLHRAEACPASCSLPQIERDDDAGYRTAGISLDAFLSRAAEVGVPQALKDAPEVDKTSFAAMDAEALGLTPGSVATQVAFQLCEDGEGAELHRGTGKHRDYSEARTKGHDGAPINTLVGTADFIGLTASQVVILDLKRTTKDLGSPGEALQLLFLAVAACRAYGRTEAKVGWLRSVGDTFSTQWSHLDAFDLDAAADRLWRVVKAVKAPKPKMAEGSWCKYCPAFSICPAKMSLFADFKTEELDADVTAWSDDQLGKAWDRANLVIEVAERVLSVVRERVSRGELALPRGRVLRMVEAERRSLDVTGVRKLLPEAVEVKESASQASIRRALIAKYGARGIQGRCDELMGKLEEAGAVRRTTHSELKEVAAEAQITSGSKR